MLPRRRHDKPVVINRTPFAAWFSPWHLGPDHGDVLVVVAKATADLQPDAAAVIWPRSAPPLGDVFEDDDPAGALLYPSDFAVLKQEADVLLHGAAYPPDKDATTTSVVFGFGEGEGAVRRRVAVFGPRTFDRMLVKVAPTEPAALERVELSYRHAFGGTRHADNPVGVGFDDDLPQLEDPDKLIVTPDDRPPAACFAAIAPSWRARRKLVGSYGGDYLAKRWPFFPEDFDFDYFQVAPASQRMAYPQGDEPYEVLGVRPNGEVLRGRLPGVVPRCFLVSGDETMLPLKLNLDTVIFDSEALTVTLLWRAVAKVSARRAPEVHALFFADETLDTRLDDAAAAARLRAELKDKTEQHASAEEKSAGQKRAEEDSAEVKTAEVKTAEVKTAEEDSAEVKTAEVKTAEQAAPGPGDVPSLSKQDALGRIEAGGENLDLQGAALAGVDLTGRALAGARLQYADLEGAKLAGCDLSGADLFGAKLDDADLEGAKLGDSQLGECSARAARFTNADAQGARFSDGTLDDANFDGARLDRASLSGASLLRATFVGASMKKTRLFDARADDAVLDDAVLTAVRAERASLAGASLCRVDAERAHFDEADLSASRLVASSLDGASFCGANAAACSLTRTSLRGAKFRGANLAGAKVLGSNLMEATLAGANLDNADFGGSNLYGAELWDATTDGTTFELANVDATNLAGKT